MKKIFTTLAIACGFSFAALAQNPFYFNSQFFSACNGPTNSIAPHISSTPGLSPSDSLLPCAVTGSSVADTIYFTNFTTSSGLTINSLKIDSLYLPAGLCWSTNKSNNTFAGGESGVIAVTGVCTAPAGQYKLRIIVTVDAGLVLSGDAEQLAHLRYNVRVTAPGAPCPPINKTDTNSAYIATVGVNEVESNISGLSVSPNPFAGTAHMTFTSEVAGAYTMKMTNLVGAVVSSKEVEITTGANNFEINRAGLSAGIYMVSLSNGQGSVTRKVVVE